MSLQAAIDDYHALLQEDLALETQAELEAQLRRRRLFFGDRPLCSVLRPRFLTPEQYRFLQERVALLLPALRRIQDRAIADASFRRQFRLADWEEQLVPHDPGFRDASPVSRLDAFFVQKRGGLKFTEYNGETPAAAGFVDVLAEMTYALPVMREFMKTYEVLPQPQRHNTLHALLDAYRQWSGRRELPRIAILDWKDVPTWREFEIHQEFMAANGIEAVIVDPRDVEYTGGRLIADGAPVDLIYKRVLIHELIAEGGTDQPVVRAVLDDAVCMVNPFRCKILHKKASLAVLSDERNADLFTSEEQEAIDAHIPWTRVVEERTTTVAGEQVDLLEFAAANREQLVLKPNDDYGGKGIVLGWEVDDDTWQRSLRTAVAEPFIVQERIELPTEPYPSVVDGELQMLDRIQDTAPFVYYGAFMDGCLTRLSTDPLVNVTAGGGSSLATFVVARR